MKLRPIYVSTYSFPTVQQALLFVMQVHDLSMRTATSTEQAVCFREILEKRLREIVTCIAARAPLDKDETEGVVPIIAIPGHDGSAITRTARCTLARN